jgi:hypothetical protein
MFVTRRSAPGDLRALNPKVRLAPPRPVGPLEWRLHSNFYKGWMVANGSIAAPRYYAKAPDFWGFRGFWGGVRRVLEAGV